ncbi:hypothetical protein Asch01_01821 [Acinetobacter schindleri]|uniref:hypothetical protein n=1 Tax=Acinetobacter schindleri TaxID=108981 RepID=UPI00309F3B9A
MTVGILGLNYFLGNIESIETIINDEKLVEIFNKKGVFSFSNARCTPAELAYSSINKTLKNVNIDRMEIDALVYASTSFWEKRFYTEYDIAWLMHTLELNNAFPIGVFLPGCANAINALHMAVNLIKADGYKNILVVTTDKVNPENNDFRLMAPDISILSDAASSFLVSSDMSKIDYTVEGIYHHSFPHMWNLDYEHDFVANLMATFKGSQIAIDNILKKCDVEKDEISKIFMNNYNVPVVQMIGKQNKFSENQLYLENIKKFAHAYASDTLINLKDYSVVNDISIGDKFLLLGTGHKNWAGTILTKV